MHTDRDFLRAEADYLRPPTERLPLCPCCLNAHDPDEGEELTAAEGAVYRLAAGTIVCADCKVTAREDLAMIEAMHELGKLGARWSIRATLGGAL